jgi:hypothetical protein
LNSLVNFKVISHNYDYAALPPFIRRSILACIFDCIKIVLDLITGLPIVSADHSCADAVTFSYHACHHFHARIITAVALGKMVLASPKAILESTNLHLVKDVTHSLSFNSVGVSSTRTIRVLNLLSHMSDGSDIEGFSQKFLALPGIDGVDSLMDLLFEIQNRKTYHIEPNSPYAELLFKIRCSFRPSIMDTSHHKTKITQKLVQECLSQLRQYGTVWLKKPEKKSHTSFGDTYRAEFEEAERRGGVFDIFWNSKGLGTKVIKFGLVEGSKRKMAKKFGQYTLFELAD